MRTYLESQGPVAFVSPFVQKYSDYRKDFISAMHHAGISFKGEILADGAIHRFAPKEKRNKDGWYVFYGLAGPFGDWSKDISYKRPS